MRSYSVATSGYAAFIASRDAGNSSAKRRVLDAEQAHRADAAAQQAAQDVAAALVARASRRPT